MHLVAIPIALLLVLNSTVSAQWNEPHWKEGAYRSCEDFWNGKVSIQGPIEFRPATALGVEEHYKVTDIFHRAAFSTIWGIYQDSCLYLNIDRHGMGDGFIRISELRPYSHFIGVSKQYIEERNSSYEKAAFGAGLAGLAGAAMIHSVAKSPQVDYLLNLETGQINEVTEPHMLRILEPYERLYKAYSIDSERTNYAILHMYIDLLNEAVLYNVD